ncbi:MAG: hypothetical protein CMJ95_09025 [Planctomycetes bacterium]|nr:hypothetical protein [Planctomycetota bacterium]
MSLTSPGAVGTFPLLLRCRSLRSSTLPRKQVGSDVTGKGSFDSDPDGEPAKAAAYVRFSSLGFQVVITFVVLALGGSWLDGKIGTSPWGTLGGVGLGLVAMVKIMLREGTDRRPSGSKQASDFEKDDSGEAFK